MSFVRWLEFTLGAAGSVLLGICLVNSVDRFAQSRVALAELNTAPPAQTLSTEAMDVAQPRKSDFTLWAAQRIAAFEATLESDRQHPIAFVRVPRIGLEAPVFADTENQSLNRGAGWIRGTAAPGGEGMTGIASHRDGFFRKLKDIRRDDEIVLQTRTESETFRVARMEIVKPEDTSMLRGRTERSLALVTCYPFYYVGAAPRRFVVVGKFASRTQFSKPHERQSFPQNESKSANSLKEEHANETSHR